MGGVFSVRTRSMSMLQELFVERTKVSSVLKLEVVRSLVITVRGTSGKCSVQMMTKKCPAVVHYSGLYLRVQRIKISSSSAHHVSHQSVIHVLNPAQPNSM